MSSIPCFMLAQTESVRRSLRRYRGSTKGGSCPGVYRYHNASTYFDKAPVKWGPNGTYACEAADPPAHDDPRWPRTCEQCSYLFEEDDEWQFFQELLFVRPDTGEEFTLREAPPGAIWDAPWYPEKGPDGLSLVVRLPDGAGDWHIDGLCRDGSGSWTRTGTPPKLTARPSVLTPQYHGWLTDGCLVAC